MAVIELSERIQDDFERILEHLAAHDVASPMRRIAEIVQAIEVLAHSPHIGRPVLDGQRELVIGNGSRGYVARYVYDPVDDLIRVVAIRHQREETFPGL